jgi:tRNA-specific 2-thiouridylase
MDPDKTCTTTFDLQPADQPPVIDSFSANPTTGQAPLQVEFTCTAHDPHFVLKIKPESNQIVVGTKEKLEENAFEVKQINLFKELTEFDCMVKVRYRTTAVPCHVVISDGRAKVTLKEPVFGLAKGQIAAFYEEDKLLGGGVIC